ncbi:MAG TPA: hypothetical protein GX705_06470 [Clostridiales bacterium]|jgi:hypothetical protein|nr:hypothetical protein [Clostridiales bacterium]
MLIGAITVSAKFTVSFSNRSLQPWGGGKYRYTIRNNYKYTLLDTFNKKAAYELSGSIDQNFYSSAQYLPESLSIGSHSGLTIYAYKNAWDELFWLERYSDVKGKDCLVLSISVANVNSNDFHVQTSNLMETGYVFGGARSWITSSGGKTLNSLITHNTLTWE